MTGGIVWRIDNTLSGLANYNPATRTISINLKAHRRAYPDRKQRKLQLLKTCLAADSHARSETKVTYKTARVLAEFSLVHYRPLARHLRLQNYMRAAFRSTVPDVGRRSLAGVQQEF